MFSLTLSIDTTRVPAMSGITIHHAARSINISAIIGATQISAGPVNNLSFICKPVRELPTRKQRRMTQRTSKFVNRLMIAHYLSVGEVQEKLQRIMELGIRNTGFCRASHDRSLFISRRGPREVAAHHGTREEYGLCRASLSAPSTTHHDST
jgi:hypothetical protein